MKVAEEPFMLILGQLLPCRLVCSRIVTPPEDMRTVEPFLSEIFTTRSRAQGATLYRTQLQGVAAILDMGPMCLITTGLTSPRRTARTATGQMTGR